MEEGCFFCKCFKEQYDIFKKKKVSEIPGCKDHLYNWEKWLKERKNVSASISKRIKRPKNELLMHTIEEQRKIVEEKILFVNERNWAYNDKYRGNPEWFKTEPRLHRRCIDDPIIEARRNNEERREIIPITYIETPTQILKEKDVYPRTRNGFDQWKKTPYRTETVKYIKKNMPNLEPHRPELANLVIVGEKFGVDKKKSIDYNLGASCPCGGTCLATGDTSMCPKNRIINLDMDEQLISTTVASSRGISVNGNEITPEVIDQGKIQIRILFISDTIPKLPLQKSLLFENTGTTKLLVIFNKFHKFRTFPDIESCEKNFSPFFFNKQELILMPFEKVYLPIWFKATNTGTFHETYFVTTSPPLWDHSFNFIMSFQGIVYEEEYITKSISILEMLDSRRRQTLAKEIINEMLNSPLYDHSEADTYTYTEKDIFESSNMEQRGPARKPKYFYDRNIIRQLTQLFYSVRSEDDPPHWNYSIDTLKAIVRKRDVLNFIDYLHKECKTMKSRAEYLADRYENQGLPFDEEELTPNSKVSVVNSDESRKHDSKIPYPGYFKLLDILNKLQRGVMIPNKEREKYASAFFVLRFYIQKIAIDLKGDLVNFINCLTSVNYELGMSLLPERLIFERFDTIWAKRTRKTRQLFDETHTSHILAKPKSTILEGIPLTDVETIHHFYFSKRNSIDKKKNKRKESVEQINKEEVKEGFDPYMKLPDSSFSSLHIKKSQICSRPNVEVKVCTKSYAEKYLIVYMNLCAAVDALVNTLESISDKKLSIPTLEQLAISKVIKAETKLTDSLASILSQKESTKSIDSYYEYLVKTYLHNPQTQKYYIKGNVLPIIEKLQEFYKPSKAEMAVIRSWTSQQYLIMDLKEEAFRTVGTQTIESSGKYGPITNLLFDDSDETIPEDLLYVEPEEEVEVDEKREILYYLNSKENVQYTSYPEDKLW